VPPFPAYLSIADGMPGEGIGHFFGAMRIDAFRPAQDFKQHMDRWIKRFRTAKPVAGQERVYIPGEIETEIEIERMREGIPLLPQVVDNLRKLGEKYDVSFDV
jgi:LDH2 family malate/lactate/ureidoglycolate dehydrogenase